ncbi:hypothetical protein AB1Y20_004057 [Prymnesium parvum]|uniref:Inositol oxygenase n=1 Tax=Prymnesium parvum TaxID=97485 RepID=A0AB34J9G8_PRYPA
MAATSTIGVAIAGMGRAGHIHLECLRVRDDVNLLYLVDPVVKAEDLDMPSGTKLVSTLAEALVDPAVDVVIVATPTPTHAPCIHAALRAKKHVFAEKPLCCEPMEAPALFAEAEKNNVLLFTALNRRHDPQILAAKKKLESGEMGRPLSITLLSGDYPYPSPLYLRTCGTLYQDCSIHDFDYVTWLLGEEPRALRSKGHTSDEERSQGTFEHACTHMSFKSGVEATFIHTRVAPSYDHRLDITCEKGTIQVVNPPRGEKPMTFRQRFDDSYIAQMSYFLLKVRSGDVQPNITLERTQADANMHVTWQMLESLSESCLESARDKNAEIRFDEHAKAPAALRTYNMDTAAAVRDLYREMRTKQTLEHVKRLREKYGKLELEMTVWEAIDSLGGFVDVSDPDVSLPNLVHLFQTAEGLREMGLPDWMQLTGLLHDMGKVIYKRGCDEDGTSSAKQYSVVGDTFIVGCALPDACIFPEFNSENLDASNPELTTKLGIYEPGCGLDNTYVAYGHDEYLYEVLRQNPGVKLPEEALYVIRYHSLYPWHAQGAYLELESDLDRKMKGWVKLFSQHDLYTKKNIYFTEEKMAEMREYYDGLIKKYLPEKLLF